MEPPSLLVGVIDWGDVALGDPAVDYACAYHLGGAEALHAATAAAGLPRDAALFARARFHAVRRAIEDIHYGVGDNRPEYVHSGRRVLDFID